MKKVVIALSGGVDSSVAAALLVKQGVEVIGVTMRLWSEPGCEQENRCCTPESRQLAKKLSEHLGFPFHILDAAKIFRKHVVQAFLDGYVNGKTPNPCIFCNQHIKWGFLLSFARSLHVDYVATGHYARLQCTDNGIIELLKGIDESKDQSYFLSMLTQDQLAYTVFPLGGYYKSQVRQLAQELGLPAANQPESQDLCFLGNRDYRSFLRKYTPQVAKPGLIVDMDGHLLGNHEGLAFYTIGQRKGLPSSRRPIYVLEKDIKQNTLIVGPAEALGKKELSTGVVNWIASEPLVAPISAQVKIRSKAYPADARIIPQQDGSARVIFYQPLRDITPGQMAVFYKGEKVLGAGFIQ